MGRLGPIASDLPSKCEVTSDISDQQLRSFRPGEVSGPIRRIRFGEISHYRLLQSWTDVK
jgi:hypothetical protein